VFEGHEMPPKPQPPTKEEAERRNQAARKIQYYWIARSLDRNRQKMLQSMQEDQLLNENGVLPPMPTSPELLQAHFSTSRHNREIDRSEAALNERWHSPNWQYAEMYQSYNHPRQGGPGGQKYDFKKTTRTTARALFPCTFVVSIVVTRLSRGRSSYSGQVLCAGWLWRAMRPVG
jgi:hypothetical protein